MKLWTFVFLLSGYFQHGTSTPIIARGAFALDIDNKTLESTTPTVINLSGLKIKYFGEKAFNGLTNIEKLNLSNNELENLPSKIFSKLNNLENLSLANNNISFINNIFVGLNNLKRVDLSNNSISTVGRGDLFGLTKSADIIVAGNDLLYLSTGVFQDPSIPPIYFVKKSRNLASSGENEAFTQLQLIEPLPANFEVKICKTDDGLVTSVEELTEDGILGDCLRAPIIRQSRKLDLSKLGLREFQRGWYKLTNDSITSLDLSRNKITEITPELLNDLPSSLSFVNLRWNFIEIIKKNVIENKYCKSLSLEYNFLSRIEDGAFEKTNLISFMASRNKLENLNFVRTLPRTIRYLELYQNSISKIPRDTFRGLRELPTLDLGSNHLKTIEPGVFEDQENLLVLTLGSNEIHELSSASFKGLKSLRRLHLGFNHIEKIARDTFSELKNSNTVFIYLYYNQIDTIEGGSFSNMNITKLDLSGNKITEKSIAKGAFNASILEEVTLADNFITKLNGELFDGVSELNYLYLFGNQIASIEKGAAKYMENLWALDLGGNPLKRLENGALYGLPKDKYTEIRLPKGFRFIQGGVFDDV